MKLTQKYPQLRILVSRRGLVSTRATQAVMAERFFPLFRAVAITWRWGDPERLPTLFSCGRRRRWDRLAAGLETEKLIVCSQRSYVESQESWHSKTFHVPRMQGVCASR